MSSPFDEPPQECVSSPADSAGKIQPGFLEGVASAVLTSDEVMEMKIEQRPRLLGHWCCEGDLGFLYAPRGVGKTWLALLIANSLASGMALGEWSGGEQSRAVLYVDGEMNLPDFQSRLVAIQATRGALRLLHHEPLFEKTKMSINLADPRWQIAISSLVLDGDVLVLDNRSALCRGLEENSNDDWEQVLGWLLELRRRRVTVLIVHHAGRNGGMRGASRPEDAAHWIIRLREDSSGDEEDKAFVSVFTKCRNCPPKDALPLRWTLATEGERMLHTCKKHAGPDAVVALVKAGVTRATEIAEELGVSPGTISKWAKKAGLVTRGRDYVIDEK